MLVLVMVSSLRSDTLGQYRWTMSTATSEVTPESAPSMAAKHALTTTSV